MFKGLFPEPSYFMLPEDGISLYSVVFKAGRVVLVQAPTSVYNLVLLCMIEDNPAFGNI